MLTLLFAAAAAVLPAPSLAQQNVIKRYFDTKLKDGPSTRWKFPPARDKSTYCGWLNAKNALGAYTGWRPFALVVDQRGKPMLGYVAGPKYDTDMVELFCSQYGYEYQTAPD